MKQVVNTNKCLIGLEKVEDVVVVHSAIDNLIKGASGQAVQNMNLMMGLSETHGLKLKSIVF
jgi:N-acetyl-gamma-glutamyl-phosphate reductase